MPSTTYLNTLPEKHEDKELQSMVDKMCSLTGEVWIVETVYKYEKETIQKRK